MKILAGLIFMLLAAGVPSDDILELEAPETFRAKFKTTKGDFVIEAHREWSPAAVDRFYQLIESGFYEDVCVFRVVDGFMAQFGIHDQKEITEFWRNNGIEDEPVKVSNKRGTVSFARAAAPRTRSSQIFINYSNNPFLDEAEGGGVVGYPPFAEVVEGMDVVDSFYNGYGNKTTELQGQITEGGNAYLKKNFPKLDYILSAEIIE
jgi:cyclophilin family peptidyl-prolyl cis-trans isomerase